MSRAICPRDMSREDVGVLLKQVHFSPYPIGHYRPMLLLDCVDDDRRLTDLIVCGIDWRHVYDGPHTSIVAISDRCDQLAATPAARLVAFSQLFSPAAMPVIMTGHDNAPIPEITERRASASSDSGWR